MVQFKLATLFDLVYEIQATLSNFRKRRFSLILSFDKSARFFAVEHKRRREMLMILLDNDPILTSSGTGIKWRVQIFRASKQTITCMYNQYSSGNQ